MKNFNVARRPEPRPCKCGCGAIVQPVRLTMRGCWSRSEFFSDECRWRYVSVMRKNLRVMRKTPPPPAELPKGTWKYWDKFLYPQLKDTGG